MKWALPAVVVLSAACGGGTSRLSGDLGAVTHVIEVPGAAVELAGKDVSGDATPSERGQPRLDIVVIDQSDARVLTPFPDTEPLGDPIRLVRDPLPYGAIEPVTDGADRLLVLAIPLLTPTREGVDHDARLIALGPAGEITGADWGGDDLARLERLLQGSDDPARTVAEAVGAVAVQAVGGEPTPAQRRLLDVIQG